MSQNVPPRPGPSLNARPIVMGKLQYNTDQTNEYGYWLFIYLVVDVVVVVVVIIAVVDIFVVDEINNGSGTKIGSEFIESFTVKWIIHNIV